MPTLKIKKITLQKQLIFLLNGEVIWQASDSPLSKELHVEVIRIRSAPILPMSHPLTTFYAIGRKNYWTLPSQPCVEDGSFFTKRP